MCPAMHTGGPQAFTRAKKAFPDVWEPTIRRENSTIPDLDNSSKSPSFPNQEFKTRSLDDWTPQRCIDRSKKASAHGDHTDPSGNLAIEVEGEAISVAREGVHEAPHQIGELVILPAPGACPRRRGRGRRRRHRL